MTIWRRIIDNPIFLAEHAHQRRAGLQPRPAQTRRGVIILLGMVGGASLCTLLLPVAPRIAQLTGARTFETQQTLVSVGSTLVFLVILTLIFQHWRWMTGAARGAAGSLAREHDGKTWESLILTNTPASQIVWGKLWASLWIALTGAPVMLLARMIAAMWFLTPLARINMSDTSALNGVTLAMSVVVALSYPLVFTLFGAACGIVASAVSGGVTVAARVWGVIGLIGMIAATTICIIVLNIIAPLIQEPGLVGIGAVFLSAPIDSGVIVLSTLLVAGEMELIYENPTGFSEIFVGMLLLNVIVYTALSWLAIRFSIMVARRRGAG